MPDTQKEDIPDITLAEVEEAFPEAFITTDFDFAAFLIAGNPDSGKPYALVEDIHPLERTRNSRGMDYRYEFVLVPTDELPTDETLHTFMMTYTNRSARVEPLAFSSARKQLRALMDKLRRAVEKQRHHSQRNR